MPKADVSEERIVISECDQRSTDWWNTLLDRLKAHHIPGRYQDGKRMWADSRGNAIIYFTSDTVSPDDAVKMLESVVRDIFQKSLHHLVTALDFGDGGINRVEIYDNSANLADEKNVQRIHPPLELVLAFDFHVGHNYSQDLFMNINSRYPVRHCLLLAGSGE